MVVARSVDGGAAVGPSMWGGQQTPGQAPSAASYFHWRAVGDICRAGLRRIKRRIPRRLRRVGGIGLKPRRGSERAQLRRAHTKPRNPRTVQAPAARHRRCANLPSAATGFLPGSGLLDLVGPPAADALERLGRPNAVLCCSSAALQPPFHHQHRVFTQSKASWTMASDCPSKWPGFLRRRAERRVLRRSSLGPVQIAIRIVGYSFTQHQTLPFPAPTCPIT
jgi:hypothetical protein